jgi:hypothetical protein
MLGGRRYLGYNLDESAHGHASLTKICKLSFLRILASMVQITALSCDY